MCRSCRGGAPLRALGPQPRAQPEGECDEQYARDEDISADPEYQRQRTGTGKECIVVPPTFMVSAFII
jgi:hypothetical protein